MRWPRKNDASSIEQRREAMGVNGSLVTSVDLEPFANAAESLVGVAVMMVLVGLAACWLPALRAAKIDPAVAIRRQ